MNRSALETPAAYYTHTVAEICELSKAVNVLVDDDQIVAFLGKSVYESVADFAGAYYDDLKSSFTK